MTNAKQSISDYAVGDNDRPRAFFVFARQLGPEQLAALASTMAQPGDVVITTDGSAHCFGVDALNVLEASECELARLPFEPVGHPYIGNPHQLAERHSWVMLPLADVALALVNWAALTPDIAMAGMVGLLWTPAGELAPVLEAMRPRLLASTRDPFNFRNLLGGA